jgi:predicted acyl esterase
MTGARCFQVMAPMRDGIRLNTCVFAPENDDFLQIDDTVA